MNYNLSSLRIQNVTQSDTTEYDPQIKFLLVFAVDGTIKVQDRFGTDVTFTIPSVANGGGAPFLIPGPFRKIYDTDTTIADAAMIAYI